MGSICLYLWFTKSLTCTLGLPDYQDNDGDTEGYNDHYKALTSQQLYYKILLEGTTFHKANDMYPDESSVNFKL